MKLSRTVTKKQKDLLKDKTLQDVRRAVGLPPLKVKERKCLRCGSLFQTIYPTQFTCCKPPHDTEEYEVPDL